MKARSGTRSIRRIKFGGWRRTRPAILFSVSIRNGRFLYSKIIRRRFRRSKRKFSIRKIRTGPNFSGKRIEGFIVPDDRCGVSLISILFLPDFCDGDAADAPVVRVDFIDDDDGGGAVFVEDVGEKIGRTFDEGAFLLGSDGSFFCDFDIDVGHGGSPF